MLRQLIDPTHGSDPYESYAQFRAPQPPGANGADNGADKNLVNGTPQPQAKSNVADGAPIPVPARRRLPVRVGFPDGVKVISTLCKFLMKIWIPLVVLAVVVVGGFSVARIHGFFGSQKREQYSDGKTDDTKPFNPKRIVYEVFGPAGTVADISYFDVNSDPKRVDAAHLPWTLDISTTLPAVMGNLVAQGNSDQIGCRITVDGVVKAERISNEVNAYTFCVVKSA